MVSLRQPLAGAIPLSALQQLAHDVERRLLVPIESGVRAFEQRLGIFHAHDGFLRAKRDARQERREDHSQKKRSCFHARDCNSAWRRTLPHAGVGQSRVLTGRYQRRPVLIRPPREAGAGLLDPTRRLWLRPAPALVRSLPLSCSRSPTILVATIRQARTSSPTHPVPC